MVVSPLYLCIHINLPFHTIAGSLLYHPCLCGNIPISAHRSHPSMWEYPHFCTSVPSVYVGISPFLHICTTPVYVGISPFLHICTTPVYVGISPFLHICPPLWQNIPISVSPPPLSVWEYCWEFAMACSIPFYMLY